ncbi:LytR/AlgR family response regulator transcription factor [Ferruginibacter yonginensis]|uniref:LytR/AlgR family response regulator transcription factor n=1 Tax=Ferruginibacter yonginensis TaxID=1310416 RepID=A0ABV8QTL4_9BACT
MKVLIVEDEAIIAESLFQVLLNLGYKPYEPCSTGKEAIHFLENHQPDIAIVDIHVGASYAGFDVAAKLQQAHIPFIFLTALYDKQTLEQAQQYKPAAYLVKPFSKENLFATIELALVQQQHEREQSLNPPSQIFIKNGPQSIAINPQDITHLEANNKYIEVHTSNGKKFLIRATMLEVLEQLAIPTLVQVHKSYAINTHYIKAIKYDSLLVHQVQIPIGRSFRNGLKKLIHIV